MVCLSSWLNFNVTFDFFALVVMTRCAGRMCDALLRNPNSVVRTTMASISQGRFAISGLSITCECWKMLKFADPLAAFFLHAL